MPMGGDELRHGLIAAPARSRIAHLGAAFKEHNVPIDDRRNQRRRCWEACTQRAAIHTLRGLSKSELNKLANITLPRRGLVSSEPPYQPYGCLPASDFADLPFHCRGSHGHPHR